MRHPLRLAYEQHGFLASAFELADRKVLPLLLADLQLFRTALAEFAAEGHARVPYLLTDAIRRAAQDPRILEVVTAILGDETWVMWGPNIREGTPNEAHRWHVDLESWLWPSVTVAVGLTGCSPESATWFLPGSQHRRNASGAAERGGARPVEARQVRGFADGCFYVFDARCLHQGERGPSADRVALFLHYQRASQPRIPYMLDYERHEWSSEPAPYLSAPSAPPPRADVYPLPWKYRAGRLLRAFRTRAR